jgi:dTDP-4-dehydrorhamnose reductase
MISVLVTGGGGQLGQSLRQSLGRFPGIRGTFLTSDQLDITNFRALEDLLKESRFDYCINCAAYTQVEKAEQNPEIAFAVNAEGVKNLALLCRQTRVVLIHISTDYVFDGKKGDAYTPEDIPNPLNQYGKSKLRGEQYISEFMECFYIIRTSWLYSEFGNNFLKTMLKLNKKKEHVRVVSDQWGAPTYSGDVADFLWGIVAVGNKSYGIYHYCNGGRASWYEFATAIFRQMGSPVSVIPITSISMSSNVRRPKNSLLSTDNTERVFNIRIPAWEESLLRELGKIVRKTDV